jgi:hypothetical protein
MVEARLFWAQTEGRLTHCSIVRDRWGDECGRVVVRYEYSVDGQEYASDRWSPSGDMIWNNSWGEMEGMARFVRSQQPLRVYYDPGDPETSAIYVSMNSYQFVFLVFPIGFCMILALGVGGAYVTRWSYEAVAARSPTLSQGSSLPPQWDRYEIVESGSRIEVSSDGPRWIVSVFVVGSALCAASILLCVTGFFLPVRFGLAHWLCPFAIAFAANRVVLQRSPRNAHVFDGERKSVFVRRAGHEQLVAEFNELDLVRLIGKEVKDADGRHTRETSLELCSGPCDHQSQGRVLLALNLSHLPRSAVSGLAARLAHLTGAQLVVEERALETP